MKIENTTWSITLIMLNIDPENKQPLNEIIAIPINSRNKQTVTKTPNSCK